MSQDPDEGDAAPSAPHEGSGEIISTPTWRIRRWVWAGLLAWLAVVIAIVLAIGFS